MKRLGPQGRAARNAPRSGAYTLSPADGRLASLHLTVWQMSQIRDRMLTARAAHAMYPPDDPCLAGRCPSGLPGIPAYKLASPDGWLVRPDEIAGALESLDPPTTGDNELWRRWHGFIDRCRDTGFKVS